MERIHESKKSMRINDAKDVQEQTEAEESTDKKNIELIEDGEKVGEAELTYRTEPFPHFYLMELYISPQHRGMGYGKKILERVNEYLKEKEICGFLLNAVEENDPAQGIYASHGWTPIAGGEPWFAFNVPSAISHDDILRAIRRLPPLKKAA